MIVGYARVSSKEQNMARQIEAFEKYGVGKTFQEPLSGKDMNRPELQKALEFCREGDTFVVTELSRLGRSTRDLFSIIDGLEARGVTFKSIKENIDTSTPFGKMLKTILISLAEYERDIIKERQYEGIQLAKQRGIYKGRKPVKKSADFDKIADMVYRGEISAVDAMKQLSLKKSTFYKFYRAYKEALNNMVIDI